MSKLVTILIPNYKTPEITKICLRLIRQHTDFTKAEIIVIDNDSQDESLAYLKTLPWITLIQREKQPNESGPLSHSRALDMALTHVTTPYVLSIHTDTFVKTKDWLPTLLAPFDANPNLAGVGSWKLESKSSIAILGRKIEQLWKYTLHKLFAYQGYKQERFDTAAHYLRSHCALYKTDIIRKLGTSFSDGEETAGKIMHQKMCAAGYDMLFMPSDKLGVHVDHLNHATMVLNPELGTGKKNIAEGTQRIKKALRGIDANSILSNNALDS